MFRVCCHETGRGTWQEHFLPLSAFTGKLQGKSRVDTLPNDPRNLPNPASTDNHRTNSTEQHQKPERNTALTAQGGYCHCQLCTQLLKATCGEGSAAVLPPSLQLTPPLLTAEQHHWFQSQNQDISQHHACRNAFPDFPAAQVSPRAE